LHFSFLFFLLKKFSDKQNEVASQTNNVHALFTVQNTLQNDGKARSALWEAEETACSGIGCESDHKEENDEK